MKNFLNISQSILNSPYVNMFLAILFLVSSISGLIENYKLSIKGISIHHGIALYGLVMFLKSMIMALQAISKTEEVRRQFQRKTKKQQS